MSNLQKQKTGGKYDEKNALSRIWFAVGLIALVAYPAVITSAAPKTVLPSIKNTSVSIPVEEFGKFIKDGRISMPWSEFEKFVVSESGSRYIRIPWELFLKYLEPATAPSIKPPADYILSSFAYAGKTEKNNLTLKFSANLFVLKDSADGWTTVRLWPVYTGFLSRISLNEKQARILTSDGNYQLLVDQPGIYRLEGEIALKLSGDALRFQTPPGSGSRISLTLPENYNVVAQGAVTLQTDRVEKTTQTEATFTPNSQVDIAWMPVIKEPDEAKILASATISYNIQPEVLRTTTSLRYEILYKPAKFLKTEIPPGVRVDSVTGDLIDWKQDGSTIQVELKPETKGTVNLYLSYEQDLKPNASEIELAGPLVKDVEKTSGYAAVTTAPNIEVAAVPTEGLVMVDSREAPGIGQRPVLAFRFNRLPFSAKLKLTRHEELPVLEATSDSANAITAVTLDGKTITRIIFHIRNNAKQFLRVKLPKAAQLWSVYVDDKPTKPLAGQGEEILIPLLKGGDRTDYAVPVEIIYYLAGKPLDKNGDFQVTLPTIDVPIMHFMYSLYLPEKIRLDDFSGSLEKVNDFTFSEIPYADEDNGEKLPVDGKLSQKGREKSGAPKVSSTSQQSLYFAQQKELEVNMQANKPLARAVNDNYSLGGPANESTAGLLPLRIYIPTTGQLLRFEKRLVIEEQLDVKARCRITAKSSFWGER